MLDFNYQNNFNKLEIEELDPNKKYNFYIIGVCCNDCRKLNLFNAIYCNTDKLKQELIKYIRYDNYFYIITKIDNYYYRIISYKEL